MAPDEGGAKRASLQGLSKERKNSFDVSVGCSKNFGRNIQGKIVGVADDIIGTGGTMVCAGAKFKEVGAKKIIAIATHGVLESGIERVKKAYDDLFLANTINCKNSNIDISKLISKTLLK